MKVPDLPEGVLDLTDAGAVPLSQQIYRAIREAVRNGTLKPDMRLPSSRKLAAMHGVSRNTVNAAYDLLRAEGIIAARPGAAPVISSVQLPAAAKPGKKPASFEKRLSARGRRLSANARGETWGREFGLLQPGNPALDAFPYELWARSLRRAARTANSPYLLYQETTGHPDLKAVLADYLAVERGVRARPEQILITSSTQASLSLLTAGLSDPGETAWIEDPGYLGARAAFHSAGLEIRGMPVDLEGADTGKRLSDAVKPRLIYVTPSHHYPFGRRMSLARRLAVISAASEAGATILEDDYDSEFLFEGRPIAALQGLADQDEVIYLGTFSKSLLPGLRVAYMVVPEPLIGPVSLMIRNTGCLANVHAQIALSDFISSGHYRAHLRMIRQLYQERGNGLVTALKEKLGNAVAVDPPTGNVQVTLCFNRHVDDKLVARAMQKRGFSVSPLSTCYLEAEPRPGLIIGFASATQQDAEAGAEALSDTLSKLKVSQET